MVAALPGFGYPQGPVSTRARIYMASPLGFSQAGRHFYDAVLLPLVRRLGYEILDPWALTDPSRLPPAQRSPHAPCPREGRGTRSIVRSAPTTAPRSTAPTGWWRCSMGWTSTAARRRRSATRSRGASG